MVLKNRIRGDAAEGMVRVGDSPTHHACPGKPREKITRQPDTTKPNQSQSLDTRKNWTQEVKTSGKLTL
jgi:hypothetical protein